MKPESKLWQKVKKNTPNIDSLSKDGQVWTDFYASSAVCTPSRAGLLTGRLPVRNGLYGDQIAVFFPNSKRGLPSEETTIAEVFQDNGYKTAIFGKWHLGDSPDFLPTRHGFDEYIGIPYSNDMDWNVNGITFDKLISNPELIESAYSEISETISKMIFNPKISDWHLPEVIDNKKDIRIRKVDIKRYNNKRPTASLPPATHGVAAVDARVRVDLRLYQCLSLFLLSYDLHVYYFACRSARAFGDRDSTPPLPLKGTTAL